MNDNMQMPVKKQPIAKGTLTSTPAPSKEDGRLKVFILMPFSEPINSYYQSIFKPALEEIGCTTTRADDLFAPRQIIDDIRQEIKHATFLLCEMTNRNPNVFYELGLAHAIGKPVILLSQKEEDIPFDIKSVRTIIYDTRMPDWVTKLSKSIQMSAKEILRDLNGGRGIYPPPLSMASDLSSDNYIEIAKVGTVKWNKLTDQEQAEFYSRFAELVPQTHKPRYSVIPIEKQAELNEKNPIDLSPLLNLLSAFELPTDNITLPISPENYLKIHEIDLMLADRIYDKVLKTITPEQEECVDIFCDYLGGSELLADQQFKRKCDVVIVPGARRGHAFRVDEAWGVCSQSGAYLILSGNQPVFFNQDEELQISEAEAMLYHLQKIRGINLAEGKVILETRAKNTRETSIHVLPNLHKIYQEKKDPLNIALVTSPNHIQRFYLLMRRSLEDFSHLVNKMQCVVSPTMFDRQGFFPGSYDEAMRRYGIRLYIQEFFKIIGGRAVGEF